MFKVNNKGTRTTPMGFGVFIVNFEHILHLALAFLLLTLNMKLPTGLMVLHICLVAGIFVLLFSVRFCKSIL